MPKILLSANTDWYLYNFRTALAKSLQKAGYDVVMVSPPGEFTIHLVEDGFRWVCWDVSRKGMGIFRELGSLIKLVQIYRQESPDLVHHHTIKPVLYGSIAARLTRVPCIVNSIAGRGSVFVSKGLKSRLARIVVGTLFRIALKFPNGVVIFENQEDRSFFIDSGYVMDSQTRMIESVGVDPEKFSPAPELDGIPVVLFSGRMLWDKGVGILVEAARKLKENNEVRVVLVGEPDPGNPGAIEMEELRKWNQEGVIEWWGWRPDMPAVYQESHIVVLPTMYGEGVPTSLIEGAASGKPLVATNMPGCAPIVHHEHNGYIVPPNDPQALAQALEKLILDPALRLDMGRKSRNVFLDRFTHAQVNDATLAVYDRLLLAKQDVL